MVLASITACGGLLDVSNPTIVRDTDIANANGANSRRLNAAAYANSNLPQLIFSSAQLTDEWMIDGPIRPTFYDLDRRDSQTYEMHAGTDDRYLGLLDQMYYQTSIAIAAVRAYTPDSLKGDYLGQLYAIRGYAVLQAAEDVCSGFPLNDVSLDNRPLFSGPISTDSALVLANAQLDSAIKYVRDSASFVTLARVTKGRALLEQGKYAEAASVVAPVGTSDVVQTNDYGAALYDYFGPVGWDQGGVNMAVGDSEGQNGLPFASAHDPRIPLVAAGTRAADDNDSLYQTTKYPDNTTHLVIASGIEARLIEAEAALHEPNPSKAFAILDTLRAMVGLGALTIPPTVDAQIDTVYKERAFWLYLTGRRLGDLRRLIRVYGRDPESVFPTGAYVTGGSYGNATAIPFILAGQQLSNPNITTGCTTR